MRPIRSFVSDNNEVFMFHCQSSVLRIMSPLMLCVASAMFSGCSIDANLHMTTAHAIAPPSKVETLSPLTTMRAVGRVPFDISKCNVVSPQFVSEEDGWLRCDQALWRTTDGGADWQPSFSDSTAISGMQSFFANENLGWIATDQVIRRTENGGQDWQVVSDFPRAQKAESVKSIQFLSDGKTGWMEADLKQPIPESRITLLRNGSVTGDGMAMTGSVLMTTDGGGTWKLEMQGEVGSWIGPVFLVNGNLPVVGSEDRMYWRIDGKWQKMALAAGICSDHRLLVTLGIEGHPEDTYGLRGIVFSDPMTGWMSFSNGYLAKTRDGGKSWCDLVGPTAFGGDDEMPKTLYDLSFVNQNEGWGIASNGSADGTILRTHDAGSHWEEVSPEVHFRALFFLNAQTGWAVSDEGVYRIEP